MSENGAETAVWNIDDWVLDDLMPSITERVHYHPIRSNIIVGGGL